VPEFGIRLRAVGNAGLKLSHDRNVAVVNLDAVYEQRRDVESAQRAINELDKQQYGGRSLTVNEAKPMTPRGNNGGGFGGGRQRRDARW